MELGAILFDYNGVIIDDEPIHHRLLCEVLGEDGFSLGADEAFEFFLGKPDRDCLVAAGLAQGRPLSESAIEGLMERKTRKYRRLMEEGPVPLFPGVECLIREAASEGLPQAICSGALLGEIDQTLVKVSLRDCFEVIVAAEDVGKGKPDPEGFLKALARLNARLGQSGPGRTANPILPRACLVIEDSPPGIEAARAGGMRCLAVASSLVPSRLTQADRVVARLEGIGLSELRSWFKEAG